MHDRTETQAIAPAVLSLQELSFHYEDNPILSSFSLDLPHGEVLALLGPSGCGKTTLLKLVAGLLAPSGGRIAIDGHAVADGASGLMLPPERRSLGMVFQDYALWPHMSVGDNVGFPLKMGGVAKDERERRIDDALMRVGLAGYGARRPGELSGGQQQRVAVARAMVGRPSLVLFDEPLSNLDRELRSVLAEEIADLMRAEKLSGLYVTHDQSEAFAVADRIVIMSRGLILQQGSPQEIVSRPATAEVAEFMALGTILPAMRDDSGWRLTQVPMFLCPSDKGPARSEFAQVLLRPEAIRIDSRAQDCLGTVCRKTFTGAGYRLRIKLGPAEAGVEVTALSPDGLVPGTPVGISADPDLLTWFD